MISFGNQIEPERSLGWSPFSFSSSFSGSGQGGKFPRIYFGVSSHATSNGRHSTPKGSHIPVYSTSDSDMVRYDRKDN